MYYLYYVPYHVLRSAVMLQAFSIGLDMEILQDLLSAYGISYGRLAGFYLSLPALAIEHEGSSLRCVTHSTGTHNWSCT